MYFAFILFLSCSIGRINKNTFSKGVFLQRVDYQGVQLGLEKDLEQMLNQHFRREGVYGEDPIVLNLISIEEEWVSTEIWALELRATAVQKDKNSPLIRYRYWGRINYPQQLMDVRQKAYQSMYQSVAEQILNWVVMQRRDA